MKSKAISNFFLCGGIYWINFIFLTMLFTTTEPKSFLIIRLFCGIQRLCYAKLRTFSLFHRNWRNSINANRHCRCNEMLLSNWVKGRWVAQILHHGSSLHPINFRTLLLHKTFESKATMSGQREEAAESEINRWNWSGKDSESQFLRALLWSREYLMRVLPACGFNIKSRRQARRSSSTLKTDLEERYGRMKV